MIIADENLEEHWITLLRTKSYEVFSIREKNPGMSDRDIAEIVRSQKGWLITEDKDFGELIFAHNIQGLSVILLRYDQPLYSQVESFLLKVMEEYIDHHEHLFITVTPGRVRVRSI